MIYEETLFHQLKRINMNLFKIAHTLLKDESVCNSIKRDQFPVFMVLYENPSMTQQEIANMLLRDKSSVQRTISSFEKKGLVTISHSETDKRTNIVSLTAAGIQIAENANKLQDKLQAIAIDSIPKAHRDGIFDQLKLLAHYLEQKVTDTTNKK